MPPRLLAFATAILWLAPSLAVAQGIQTGTIQGSVRDTQRLPLPGVSVTVSSPALQGLREAVTDENGLYILRGLPNGEYRVRFELSGMRPVEQIATVAVGQPTEDSATLDVGGVQEQVTVSARAVESAVTTTTGGANITAEEVNRLPIGRTPQAIAQLSPGLTTNTPNAGQLTISGGFAYDNVFLVDGVDINDNLFGTANNLFIEDALEQAQVLTSGISAEYGRFSGGVINVVTRSGGDTFSGSYRATLTNDAWIARTPLEREEGINKISKVNPVHEATFGGPVVPTKLWFFGAGRFTRTETTEPLPQSGIPFTTANDNTRGEIKLTGTVAEGHTLTGSYLNNAGSATRPTFGFTIDPKASEEPSFPNDRWVAGWQGVLSSRVLAQLRFSRKRFGFEDTGGTSTDIVDSPFITLTQDLGHYNAPYFDATDPEDRDNWQVTGNVSYFLTTPAAGSHEVKGGFEVYNSTNTGGNSQSATGYVFDADYLADGSGAPVLDGADRFIPLFVPEETILENWIATRGAQIDIRTTSLFLQDHWAAGDRLSFDLGLRYERVRSDATGGIVGVDTDSWMPRLAASYDVRGDGRLLLQTTYAYYSGKYSEAQFAGNTPVGNPASTFAVYTGPAGQGRDFAAGFAPGNYTIVDGSFPTANVQFEDGLSSPVSREFTVSLGGEIGRGHAKATYIQRHMSNFVEDFLTLDTGASSVEQDGIVFGPFTNAAVRNSDLPQRDYRALQFIGSYRLSSAWQVAGNWTVQLQNDGNFEGEATNQPGISSVLGDYPELLNEARHYPVGRLNDFQRHRLQLWTTYSFALGPIGATDVSVIYRYDSPLTYSLQATGLQLTGIQQALGAGYATLPSSQDVFFGERGSELFAAADHIFDVSVGYTIPMWQRLRPFVKVDILNLFNDDTLINWNTAVDPDPDSPTDALGLATGFVNGDSFGTPVDNDSYPIARTFRIALGVRF